jgi:hypothetical protein
MTEKNEYFNGKIGVWIFGFGGHGPPPQRGGDRARGARQIFYSGKTSEISGHAKRISHMANSCNPIETLCRHAAASLPDSISERKIVLVALEKVLKPQHPVYRDVQANLAAIEAAEKLQRELHIHFMPIQPS